MSKRDIIAELKKQFPHLAKEIDNSAEAILDAYEIVEQSKAEGYQRDKQTLSTLAKTKSIPAAVAKEFMIKLDPTGPKDLWDYAQDVAKWSLKNTRNKAEIESVVRSQIANELRKSFGLDPTDPRAGVMVNVANLAICALKGWSEDGEEQARIISERMSAARSVAASPSSPPPLPTTAAAAPAPGDKSWSRKNLPTFTRAAEAAPGKAGTFVKGAVKPLRQLSDTETAAAAMAHAAYEKGGWFSMKGRKRKADATTEITKKLMEDYGIIDEKEAKRVATEATGREYNVVTGAVSAVAPGLLRRPWHGGRREIAAEARSFYNKRMADKRTLEHNKEVAQKALTKSLEDLQKDVGGKDSPEGAEIEGLLTAASGAAALAGPEGAAVSAALGGAKSILAQKMSLSDEKHFEQQRYMLEVRMEGIKAQEAQLKYAREQYDKFSDNFKEEIRTHLKAKVDGIVARHGGSLRQQEREDLRAVLADEAEHFADFYITAVERGNIGGYEGFKQTFSTFAFGGQQFSGGMRYFLTEWWGPIVWMLFYAGGLGGSIGLIALIIWAFMKIPLMTGITVGWFQLAFFTGGTVLGLLQVPEYVPTGSYTGMLTIAVVGCFANWLMNIKTNVETGPLFTGGFAQVIEQLTHFVAGGMIVMAVELLMMGLGLEVPSFMLIVAFLGIVVGMQMLAGQAKMGMEWMPFIMILSAFGVGAFGAGTGMFNGLDFALFLIFLMLGMTSFYPSGGMRSISMICVAILVFGYFSMGPYAAPIHEAVDQAKQPMRVAWSLMHESFNGVWLLMTNPTEYYAKQQLQNVRSERPLSWPQGVEITTLATIPEGTVPSYTPFSMFVVAQNKADFAARSVIAIPWCKSSASALGGIRCSGPLASDGTTDVMLGVNPSDLENLTAKAYGDAIAAVSTLIPADDYKPYTLPPGAARRWSFDFEARGRTDARAAETIINKIGIFVIYTADTNSTLPVEVATKAEINRRAMTGETQIYKPVVSTAKSAPAQLSLNVGPQPLEAVAGGKSATLIMAVSNTRPDGSVYLKDVRLIVDVSQTVGNNLQCRSRKDLSGDVFVSTCDNPTNDECTITILRDKPIRAYEFKDVIPILCTFTVADSSAVTSSRTGLIKAELRDYKFVLTQEKSVSVGPPLGIINQEGQTQTTGQYLCRQGTEWKSGIAERDCVPAVSGFSESDMVNLGTCQLTTGCSACKASSKVLECVKQLDTIIKNNNFSYQITCAYDITGHASQSRHETGQAIDFQPQGTSYNDPHQLSVLASYARQTNCFDWVYVESTHVHASVKA